MEHTRFCRWKQCIYQRASPRDVKACVDIAYPATGCDHNANCISFGPIVYQSRNTDLQTNEIQSISQSRQEADIDDDIQFERSEKQRYGCVPWE